MSAIGVTVPVHVRPAVAGDVATGDEALGTTR
jgi:hypothetical protein